MDFFDNNNQLKKITIYGYINQLITSYIILIIIDIIDYIPKNNKISPEFITIYNQSINSIEEFSTNISSLTNKNSFDYIDNNTLIDEINPNTHNKQHVVLQDFIMQKYITHQTT